MGFRALFILTPAFVVFFVLPDAHSRPRLLTNGSLARGALDPKSYHEGTYYELMQKQFDEAGPLRSNEINGWYAGRCFFSDSPMQAVASLLIVGHSPKSREIGPAFSSSSLKSALPLIDTETPPDSFDTLSKEQRSVIRSKVQSKWRVNGFATDSDRSLIVDGLRTFDVEARSYELRRKRNFIFLRLSCAEPGFCFNDRGNGTGYKLINSEGESTTACYYFKRLAKRD